MGPAPNGVAGAAIALVAIFLPGLLLVYGDAAVLGRAARAPERPGRHARRQCGRRRHSRRGALQTRSGPAPILTPRDFALALAGFLLLSVWKAPPWIVVALLAAAGALLGAARMS